ncbi:hypothetical protein ACFL2H_02765 [Planctomycetota bacterium]
MSFTAGMYSMRSGSPSTWNLNEKIVRADSATSNESFAMATGPIDQDVDGLITLDFLSGELQCVVLNRRTGKFNGLFKANVSADLGVAQNTKYLMTTGRLNSPGQGGNSVIYVMDTTSGNFAAYGVPWRSDLASTQNPQSGGLILTDVGRARNAPIRGQ